MSKKQQLPKVLIFDVETSYLESTIKHWDSHVSDYIPHDKMKIKEWSILSVCAKWLGSKNVIYFDNRNKKDKRDDKTTVAKLGKLLDKADVIITKNGKRFDEKMFNARCAKHRLPMPSPYRHIDVEQIVRRKFRLVSYSLDYLCEFFNTEHKKLKHAKFPGMMLWEECMKGNREAWEEMKKYNINDVLASEDVYNEVKIWDKSVSFQVYNKEEVLQCNCGSTKLQKRGFNFSNTGRHQRYQCLDCGSWLSSKQNLLTKEKRAQLLK